MGLRTLAVFNNDYYGSLHLDNPNWAERLLRMMRGCKIGSFGPGAEIVSMRAHDATGLLYFNGTTLEEVDSDLIPCSNCRKLFPGSEIQKHRALKHG